MAKKKKQLQKQINAKLKNSNTNKAKPTYSATKKKKVVKKVRKNNTVNITNKPIKSVTKIQKSEPKLIKIENVKSTAVNKTKEKEFKISKEDKDIKRKKATIKKLEKELNKESKKALRKAKKDLKVKEKENVEISRRKNKSEKVKKEKTKRSLSRKQKIYFLFFIATIILIILLIIGITRNEEKIFFDFKSYKIGDVVTLENDSKWYVVNDSGIDKKDILLLSATILDINKDKKVDEKDKMSFDSDNQTEYTTKNDKNIGYFLNEKANELLDIKNVKQIRLLTSEEYIKIRRTMEFGYDWKEGNWLAGKDLGTWWLNTSKYNKIYAVNEKGSYRLSNANSKNYVRVVIKVNKDIIKQN